LQVLFIVFATVVGIQIVFTVLFLVAFSRRQSARPRSENPPVSIVVCAHDELHNLRELIPVLLSQNYPTFEVIVVNDRSNDDTFDWLLSEAKKDHRLRMVHVNRLPEHVTGKKYALTLGIRAATFDWILLTDADCRPASDNWIQEMSSHYNSSTQFVLGFSPYFKSPGFLNLFIRFEAILTAIQYLALALLKAPYMGVGRNLSYRKSFFMENKGFNNLLHVEGGDDDLYVSRHALGSNTEVCMGANSLVRSVPKLTWREFFHQKIRHLSVGKRYAFKFRVILGLFMISWLLTWFTAIPLFFHPELVLWTAGLFAFRWIMLVFVFQDASKRLGEKFEVWTVPILDFVFSIYYISTGVSALLTKKVRWKKN
jgi:glycosyltransferase involved in cell wall biosynthesis